MLLTEKLKEKLGEHYDLIKDLVQDKEIYVMEAKDYLPKDKANELRNEVKILKESKETLNSDLEASKLKFEELKAEEENKGKTTEDKFSDLSKQIEALVNQNAEKDKALERSELLSMLNNDLTEAKVNPKYRKQVLAEFDIDSLKKNESGKVDGVAERLTVIQENFPIFFGEEKLVGNPLETGDGINMSQNEIEYEKIMSKETITSSEQVRAMELAEQIKTNKKE